MKTRRILTGVLLGLACAALAAPPAGAAEEKTVLTFSIKEARASLWQIHYPQKTFISEAYAPCDAEEDPYECDRTRYNQDPDSCPKEVALGRTKEATLETPTEKELADAVDDDNGVGADEWPKQPNPVTVIHGIASGHLAAVPEAGGFASMWYVDNSGRRETEAHAESDAFVGNRNDYEERCAIVDAFSEGEMYPGPFVAHTLSRATEAPSVYSMTAFTTLESALLGLELPPPGSSKESVAIVKLFVEGGRVKGLITSTVRGVTLEGGAIVVDAIRSVISFTSDGTEKGLDAVAKTTVTGVRIGDAEFPGLSAGQLIDLGQGRFLGIARPVVNVTDQGHRVTIRAPGVFLAAGETGLEELLPIPEDPLQDYEQISGEEEMMEALKEVRAGFCERAEPSGMPCPDTLGGRLKDDQAVFVAGAFIDAGVGRVPPFDFLPNFPPLPTFPPFTPTPPQPGFGGIAPPPLGPQPQQPVALPRVEVRELAGSPWPLLSIVTFAGLGFFGIMGRWSTRFAWARAVSRYPPFPAFGWAYRAFLKG